jgi:hypothetical protein
MGLLDGGASSGGGFDTSALLPWLSAIAAAGAANPPQAASRLPLAQPSLAYQLSQAAGGYAKGLDAQQQLRAAQIQNQLGGLTLQGYQRLQGMNGGPPTANAAISNGILSGSSPVANNASPPTGSSFLDRLGNLLGFGGSSTGNPAADAHGVGATLAASPAGTTAMLPGTHGILSPHTTVAGDGSIPDGGTTLPLTAMPSQRSSIDAVANGFAPSMLDGTNASPAPSVPGPVTGAATPSASRPLFDLGNLMQQYRVMAATPGMSQQASQILSLIEKGLPEGAQINADGSISARSGYNKFVTDKAMGDKGFTPVANGGYAPASGGPADLGYIGQAESAKEWGGYAPKLALEINKPYALRGPGSSLIQGGRVVAQNPMGVEGVDSAGHPYTSFLLPPIGGGNNGLLSGGSVSAGGGGILSGNPTAPGIAGSNVPLAFRAAAGQPQTASAGGPNITVGANGMPTIQKGLSPLEESSAKERGNALELYGKDLDTLAQGGVNNNFLVDQMRRESQTWQQGKFADFKNDALAYLESAGKTLGVDTTGLSQRVGDFQSFNKNAMELVRQSVRQTSSRAAVQEFTLIQQALPNAEMTARGFGQIADQLQGLNDYHIAAQSAAQQWRSTHNGTLDNFESAWNQAITPAAFLVHRMSGDDLATMAGTLQRTPEGRATLGKIQQEITTAQKLGLFGDGQ